MPDARSMGFAPRVVAGPVWGMARATFQLTSDLNRLLAARGCFLVLRITHMSWWHTAILIIFWFLAGSVPSGAQTISTSDGLSLTMDGSGTITSIVVDTAELVATADSAITVRDLSLAGTTFAPNLLYNGGFEVDDGSGGADGWSVYTATKANVSVVTDFQAEGQRSAFFETALSGHADGSAAYLSSPFGVTAGQR